jgi:hypothetical protein
MGDLIDRRSLVNLILSEDGLFKDVPHGCRKYVVFNKADHSDRRKEAEITAHELIEMLVPIDGFIIAAIGKGCIYTAGGAVRRSKLKQALSKDLRG